MALTIRDCLSQGKARLASTQTLLPSGVQPHSTFFFQSLFPSGSISPPRCETQLPLHRQIFFFFQMKSLPLAVLPLPEGPGCPCMLQYWGGSYRGEQLPPSTWCLGLGGCLLTQSLVPLAFLQMCVPGLFFLVESHFAISCPVPGYSPTPPPSSLQEALDLA